MSSNTNTKSISSGAAVLWATAIVLVGLIITTAARMPGNTAHADVAQVADLTIVTATSMVDEEVLAVLDARSERIMVYAINQGRSVELYEVQNLSELFTKARGNTRR